MQRSLRLCMQSNPAQHSLLVGVGLLLGLRLLGVLLSPHLLGVYLGSRPPHRLLLHASIAPLITASLSISPPRALVKSLASISAVGKPSSSSQMSAGDR